MRSERVSYQDVIGMLQAYFDVLMRHQSYVKDIGSKKVSEEDIRNYFREIFGMTDADMPKDKGELESLLSNLKAIIDARSNRFLKFLIIAKNKNQKAAMATLYYMLDIERQCAEVDATMARKRGSSAVQAIIFELVDAEYMRSLYKKMERLVPQQQMDALSKVVETEITKNRRGDGHAFTAMHRYAWRPFYKEIADIIVYLEKQRLKALNQEGKLAGLWALVGNVCAERGLSVTSTDMHKTAYDINALLKKIRARIDADEKDVEKIRSAENHFKSSLMQQDQMFKNIEFYYEIEAEVAAIMKAKNDYLKREEIVEELSLEALRCKKIFEATNEKVNAEILQLEDKNKQLKNFITAAIDKSTSKLCQSELKKLLADIDSTSKQLEKYKQISQVFNGKYHVKYNNEFITDVMNTLGEARKVMLQYHDDCMAAVADIKRGEELERVAAEEQKAIVAAEAAESRRKAIIEKEKEREARLEQDRQRDLARKEAVAREREQKVEKTREAKAAQVVAEQPQPVEVETTTLINKEFDEKLLKMSNDNFLLLQELFLQKKPVRYTSVVNLIEEVFGGEVIARDGSHRTIKIDKYIVNVTSHPVPKETKKPKAKKSGKSKKGKAKESNKPKEIKIVSEETFTATAGFFQPHEDAQDMMGPFNMGLVADAFKKAGLTQELLDEMEVKRRERKAGAGYSPRALQ